MRPMFFALCLLLALGGVSCKALYDSMSPLGDAHFAMRPKYQEFDADVEFDGMVNGVTSVKNEPELEFKYTGLEGAVLIAHSIELYVDYGRTKVENNHNNAKAEGPEVGFGVRSPNPSESGWGVDWNARFNYHDLEDSENTMSGYKKEELEGIGLDLSAGPYYALPLANDYLFSPRIGVWFKALKGDNEVLLDSVKVTDADYDLRAVAGYAGFRVNHVLPKYLDFTADFYMGSDDLTGFLISLGVRF